MFIVFFGYVPVVLMLLAVCCVWCIGLIIQNILPFLLLAVLRTRFVDKRMCFVNLHSQLNQFVVSVYVHTTALASDYC